MKLFVSTLSYELGKALGVREGAAEFSRQAAAPDESSLPAARVVALLRELGDVMHFHGNGSNLPKVRSRAAHAALTLGKECDLWVMVDDDVECDLATLQRLIAVASDPREPTVAALPCVVRGVDGERLTLNCVWEGALIELVAGAAVRRARRIGCGLMVVPRRALELVTESTTAYGGGWHDDDDQHKAPLFSQLFLARSETDARVAWLGEDYSFCERLRTSGIPIMAVVEGVSVHDGCALELKRCQ